MYVMYNFLNKLFFNKSKNLIALKTLGKPKNFNKTPLGETGYQGNPYVLLTGCLGNHFFDLPLSQHSQLVHCAVHWLPAPHCAALV